MKKSVSPSRGDTDGPSVKGPGAGVGPVIEVGGSVPMRFPKAIL